MENKVHDWFGLSYSSYIVLQRSILQSMPNEWQEKFVLCLDELSAYIEEHNLKNVPGEFWVRAKSQNRFIHDPYKDYQRGRRNVFISHVQE